MGEELARGLSTYVLHDDLVPLLGQTLQIVGDAAYDRQVHPYIDVNLRSGRLDPDNGSTIACTVLEGGPGAARTFYSRADYRRGPGLGCWALSSSVYPGDINGEVAIVPNPNHALAHWYPSSVRR